MTDYDSMSELKTKFDLIHEAMTQVQLYPEDAETVLNRIWRVAFWRGGQNMAKVMREGGHVVYDHPKEKP
jgi:hypothetical protein